MPDHCMLNGRRSQETARVRAAPEREARDAMPAGPGRAVMSELGDGPAVAAVLDEAGEHGTCEEL